jgi:hypothetical protein
MGNVFFGIPERLCLLLRDTFDVTIFIETGTYEGQTTDWAAKQFANVITIENSEHYYTLASIRFRETTNVTVIRGDSAADLVKVVKSVGSDPPTYAIFWLDAHWCGGETAGAEFKVPLIDELRALQSTEVIPLILIDDARYFLAPPLSPDSGSWPSLQQVLDAMPSHYYVVVIHDIIIAVPERNKQTIVDYCLEYFRNEQELQLLRDRPSTITRIVRRGRRLFASNQSNQDHDQ